LSFGYWAAILRKPRASCGTAGKSGHGSTVHGAWRRSFLPGKPPCRGRRPFTFSMKGFPRRGPMFSSSPSSVPSESRRPSKWPRKASGYRIWVRVEKRDRRGGKKPDRRFLRIQGHSPRAFRISAISSGTTRYRSPTIPRSAIWKMGAFSSLFTAAMSPASRIPVMCCIWPEMPSPM